MIKKYLKSYIIAITFLFGMSQSLFSQSANCEITKVNGGGFTTTIESVICNPNNTYSIVLRVEHNGCGGPSCRELSHYSIEAQGGTYSNVSWQLISGQMAGGNVVMGPNLGSDPFNGFKIDNTRRIGGGRAGVFKVSYTLSGALQPQRVSAKAGPSGQIVSFSVQDFEYVMNCNNKTCGPTIVDSDGDGVPDDQDEYPNDPERAFNNIFPSCENATIAFEDLWPAKGDYDFNDMVIEYSFLVVTNAQNKVVDIKADFTVRAFGAGYRNGFGFQLPNANIDQSTMTVSGQYISGNLVNLGANGLELNQSKPTVIVFTNSFDFMPHPGQGSIGVNTTPGTPYVQPYTVNIDIYFNNAQYSILDLGIANFNPFIISNQTRGREVHLPDYEPTDLVDASYFGTSHDNSNPSQGKYYRDKDNLPWGIMIPSRFHYPKEKVIILDAHLRFGNWVQSNGSFFQNWYLDLPGYRNNANIYQVP